MAKACSNCAAEAAEDARFCGSCGTPFPAPVTSGEPIDATVIRPAMPSTPPPAPGAVPQPPAPPAATGTGQAVDVGALTRTVARWDWRGPALVASALLGTSLALSVVLGLLGRISSHRVHWDFHTTITGIGTLWAQIFGADFIISGKADVPSFGDNGSASASGHAALSFVPLTLTLITFAVGIALFKRATASYTSLLGAALFAVRTAVLTVIPMWFISLFIGLDLDDVKKWGGSDCSSSMFSNSSCDSSPLDSIHGSFSAGPSSWQLLFMGFLLIVVVLLAATLGRPALYAGNKVAAILRTALHAPVAGFGWLLVALVPAGWILFASVWFTLPSSTDDVTNGLTGGQWLNIVSGVFAYGGNLGTVALGLGTWGSYGGSAHAMGQTQGAHRDLSWIAGSHGGDSVPGFWVAAALAPIVVAFVAMMVARSARQGGASATRVAIGTWVVSLIVAFPLLDNWSSLRGHGSAEGFGLPIGGNGSVATGFSLGFATFMVLVYAALIGLLVLIAQGALDEAYIRRAAAAVRSIGGPAKAAPVTYQVGDVVNGHRFDGTQWVPVDVPPPPPPRG